MPRIKPTQSCTIDDMRSRPGMLITPSDLAGAGIVSNYATLNRWLSAGALPQPFKTPGGGLRWRAGDILDALGMAQVGNAS